MPRDPAQPAASPAKHWLPLFVAAAAVLVLCWWSTWFLCDDAFIAFRYVGNSHDGNGLVWNPAPFAPVEGYSCFLWVVSLGLVWSMTGLAPPVTANWLALAFALASLWTVHAFLRRRQPMVPAWLTALVLLGIATSVTFATWASSGLETAMFGFFAIAWTLGLAADRSMLRLSVFAALAALTRPDGGLLVLATLAVATHAALTRRASIAGVARGLLPLVLPLVHVGWRRFYYGEWLPNTYHAKVVAAWPESGLRYLYCFVLEHGLVLWLALAAVWLVRAAMQVDGPRRSWNERFAAVVAVSTWLLFVGYYTLVVGGDHFGFRPFAHLVPLLFAACAIMVTALRLRPWAAAGVLLALVAFGNGFGWWHERALVGRGQDGFVRAGAALPSWIAPLFATRDRHRAWLRLHYVALPRALHAEICDDLLGLLPERRTGQVAGLDGRRGIYRTVAAGVVGWSLADVAILDAVGLNDWVVARNPSPPSSLAIDPRALGGAFAAFDGDRNGRLDAGEIAALAQRLDLGAATGVVIGQQAWGDILFALCDQNGDGLDEGEFRGAVEELRDTRHMAHERTPPAGYVEALRPNVVLEDGRFVAVPAIEPLTDSEIVEVERRFRARVRR